MQAAGIQQVHLQQPIQNISAGAFYSLARSENGIWFWGESIIESAQKFIQKPTLLNIQGFNLASGPKHAFAWSKDKVYCWGSNIQYQLGLEEEKIYGITISSIFEEAAETGLKIKQFSCGASHTIAVLQVEDEGIKSDQVFVWGQSKNYQLALDTTSIVPYPVQIQIPETQIKSIYSRSDYNIVLTGNGECYSWGSNIFGRVGNLGIHHHKIPMHITNLKKVNLIAMGLYHCIAITTDQEAYSWGHGMQGQLGLDRIVSQALPSRIQFSQTSLIGVSCGEYHTVVIGANNKLYSCGSNSHEALGHQQTDSKKRCKKLTEIEWSFKDKIMKISCGNRHNLALTENGSVYSWGSNKMGQLGPAKHKQQEQGLNRKIEKGGYSGRLRQWKQRYQKFQREKAEEEKAFMGELQEIMSMIHNHDN